MGADPLQDAVRAAAQDLKRRLLEPEAPPAPAPEIPPPPAPEPEVRIEAAVADLLQAPEVPPSPAVPAVPPPPASPDDLESLIQSEFSRPVEGDLPGPQDRQALEAALGISAPPPPSPAVPAVPPPPSSPEDLESLIQSEMSKPADSPGPKMPAIQTPAPVSPRVKPSFSPPPPTASVPAALAEPPSKAGLLAARSLGFCWTGLIGILTMADRAVPPPWKARKPLLGRVGIAATLAAMLGLGIWACMRFARD